MILTVTLNPCIDLTLFTKGVELHDSNKVLRSEMDAGGKGVNLSRMIVELSGETLATGLLGGDTGLHIEAMLRQKGVPHEFVEIGGETRTNVSIESGDGPPTVFNAPGPQVNGLEWENLLALVARRVGPDDWVSLGGSLPPGVPVEAYKILGQMAKAAGAKLLLDADKDAFVHGLEAGPDLVKPNKDEAERLLGMEISTLADALSAVKALHSRLLQHGAHHPVAIISLGDKGAVLSTAGETLFGVPPEIRARSTIGSGDSFLGGFLVELTSGRSFKDALRRGVAAGAATAQSDGTRIGTMSEVTDASSRVAILDEGDLSGLDYAL